MKRRAPAGPLAAWVRWLWVHDRPALPQAQEWLLPTAAADLVVPLSRRTVWRHADDGTRLALAGGVFQGPSARPRLRDTGGALHVAGVHFRPGGAVAVLGAVAREGTGRCLALDRWHGGAFAGWRAALRAQPDDEARLAWLEAALQARWAATRAAEPEPDRRLVNGLHALLDGAPRVGPVQRASGLSAARFSAGITALTGLPPRTLLRVQRLQAAATALGAGTPAAAVAAATGHGDQAHLNDEFRALLGHTPGQVQAAGPAPPGHLPVRNKGQDRRRGRG